MNDLEKQLKDIPLRQPSKGLDSKMNATFTARSRRPRALPMILLSAAAIALLGLSAAVFWPDPTPRPTAPVNCVVEIPAEKAWIFDTSPTQSPPLFERQLSDVQVIFVARNNDQENEKKNKE